MVVVGIAAVLANLFAGGGSEPDPEAPQVAFTTQVKAHSDAGTLRKERRVAPARVRTERTAITELLDRWYQGAFVEASVFELTPSDDPESPSFPSADLLGMLTEDARAALIADIDPMTLGTERTTFARVEPTRTTAAITVFFRNARTPTLAVADVTFEAEGTLKDGTAFPVAIVQRATVHLAHEDGGWKISFFEATQEQDSILPPPTGTPTEEAS